MRQCAIISIVVNEYYRICTGAQGAERRIDMKYDKMQADILKGFVKRDYWLDYKGGSKFFYRNNETNIEFTLDGYIMFVVPKKAWFLTVPEHYSPLQRSLIEDGIKADLQSMTYSYSTKIDEAKNPVDVYTFEDGEDVCINPDLYKGYLDKWDKFTFKGTKHNAPVFAFDNNNEVAFMILPINRKKIGR